MHSSLEPEGDERLVRALAATAMPASSSSAAMSRFSKFRPAGVKKSGRRKFGGRRVDAASVLTPSDSWALFAPDQPLAELALAALSIEPLSIEPLSIEPLSIEPLPLAAQLLGGSGLTVRAARARVARARAERGAGRQQQTLGACGSWRTTRTLHARVMSGALRIQPCAPCERRAGAAAQRTVSGQLVRRPPGPEHAAGEPRGRPPPRLFSRTCGACRSAV